MGKPNFDVLSYFNNEDYINRDFTTRKAAIDELRKIIKKDITSIEILKDNLYINLVDGRKYNWRMNSVEDNNFTVLTHVGEYEREVYELTRKIIKQDATVIDVGANKGWYSILFGKLAKNGVIYAIEPVPTAYAELKQNIKINGLSNIKPYNLAFSDYNGKGDMSIPFKHSSLAYLKPDNSQLYNTTHVKTIDSFVEENNIGEVDILKIDAEGSEYGILIGAQNTLLSKKAPIIIVEAYEKCLLRFGKNTGDLIQLLRQYGYYIYDIETLEEYNTKIVGLDTDLICFKRKMEDII